LINHKKEDIKLFIVSHVTSLYLGGIGVCVKNHFLELVDRIETMLILRNNIKIIKKYCLKDDLKKGEDSVYKNFSLVHKTAYLLLFIIYTLFIIYRNKGKRSIIHSHDLLFAGIVARLSYNFFKIPYILHEHGSYLKLLYINTNNYFLGRIFMHVVIKIINYNIKYARFIITDEIVTYNILLKIGVSKELIRVIPDYYNDYKKIKKNNTKIKNIGYVGRLAPEKNVLTLIKAFNHIQKTNKLDLKLWIIGDGTQKNKLEKYVIKQKIKNVIFVGYQKNIYKYYNKIDLLVLPSFTEGYPQVIKEAFILKIPVIASKIPTLSLMSENENNMLLFKYDDYVDLSNKIIYAIENDQIINTKVNNAYEYINNKFNNKLITNKFINLYKQIIKGIEG